jgi:hypothetical protein
LKSLASGRGKSGGSAESEKRGKTGSERPFVDACFCPSIRSSCSLMVIWEVSTHYNLLQHSSAHIDDLHRNLLPRRLSSSPSRSLAADSTFPLSPSRLRLHPIHRPRDLRVHAHLRPARDAPSLRRREHDPLKREDLGQAHESQHQAGRGLR